MVDDLALAARFRAFAGGEPRLFRAPGRVNLIGEHTDYNDGFVLPMALGLGTWVAAGARGDRALHVRSVNEAQDRVIDLDAPGATGRGDWVDYVEGVARALARRGVGLVGANLVIESDVPLGSGLSSSAALEVSVGLALVALAGADLPPEELALAGQEAEHTYVGTQCGIMDQLVAARGRAGHALLIDCRSLEVRFVRLALPGRSIAVTDSGVRHALASSEYNVRRAECRAGLERLARHLPGIRALRDVTPADLERWGAELGETALRRCRHVVGENERTLAAADALERGDAAAFGRLMVLSHRSLADDYAVSTAELDALVEIALGVPGVAGSRMTGGGFGGSTVTLVASEREAAFEETVRGRYRDAVGREAVVRVVEPGDGAAEVSRRP